MPGLNCRHPDVLTPKLRGYEQKRHGGSGSPGVSDPWITKPFPTGSGVDGELVQRKFTFLFGEICGAYP